MKLNPNSANAIKVFKLIKELDVSDNSDDGRINIFMCPINARKFDYDAIADRLVDSAVEYALSLKVRRDLQEKEKHGTISKLARQKYKDYKKNKGELGELILFCFLEGHLGAPKILTKLGLKTSNNLYVNGADGVHLLKTGSDRYQLIFGESKTYKDFFQALKEAFESIRQFEQGKNSSDETRRGISYEKMLISSNIEQEGVLEEEDKEILAALLCPTEKPSELNVDDAFGIFIGYEINISSETKVCTHEEFHETVKEKILKELQNIEDKIYNLITSNRLSGHTFYLYILPLTELDKTREYILEKALT